MKKRFSLILMLIAPLATGPLQITCLQAYSFSFSCNLGIKDKLIRLKNTCKAIVTSSTTWITATAVAATYFLTKKYYTEHYPSLQKSLQASTLQPRENMLVINQAHQDPLRIPTQQHTTTPADEETSDTDSDSEENKKSDRPFYNPALRDKTVTSEVAPKKVTIRSTGIRYNSMDFEREQLGIMDVISAIIYSSRTHGDPLTQIRESQHPSLLRIQQDEILLEHLEDLDQATQLQAEAVQNIMNYYTKKQ